MQIGELAATTGTTVRVLRHYEKQGLILAGRRQSGYRDYPAIMVERVNYGAACTIAERRTARLP
jgi:MerR family transcriptional regulator, copper efflux regulator